MRKKRITSEDQLTPHQLEVYRKWYKGTYAITYKKMSGGGFLVTVVGMGLEEAKEEKKAREEQGFECSIRECTLEDFFKNGGANDLYQLTPEQERKLDEEMKRIKAERGQC